MDITQLILDDHHEQRRLFSIIEQVAAADEVSLAAIWQRLSAFLEVHALAEETIFYPKLLKSGKGAGGKSSAADETLDAIKDHNEIRDAVAKVADHRLGSSSWFKAIAMANKANSDHMAEEEREGMTDFRNTVDLDTRHELGVQFIAFEARNVTGVVAEDIRPKEYIRKHSE